jgi:prolipoprotein diacylglyceryltransferase
MNQGLKDILNTFFDAATRPQVCLCSGNRSIYLLFGLLGAVLAAILGLTLAAALELSMRVMIVVTAAAYLTFFGLALTTKVLIGREMLVYYHHEIATLLISALLLRALHQPLLPYLDVVILGIGLLLAFGRLGCLMAGCCHGQPYPWGVCYRQEHVRAGFPPYLNGIRLFPIQAVESLLAFLIVAVGVCYILQGPAGKAMAWYVVSYGLGRFTLEFFRGDPGRLYYGSFSEAQWFSVFSLLSIAGPELAGGLPFHYWHLSVALSLPVVILAIAIHDRRQGLTMHRLLHPQHLKELLAALRDLTAFTTSSSDQNRLKIWRSSLGLQISVSHLEKSDGRIYVFGLSSMNGHLSVSMVRKLACLVLHVLASASSYELIEGRKGVYHFLVRQGNMPQTGRLVRPHSTEPTLPIPQ